MSFVIIEKNKKSPPSDAAIEKAMTMASGQVVTIESESDSKTVTFTGEVNHTVFQNALETTGSGNKLSWNFHWGDAAQLAVASAALSGVSGTKYSITIHNNSKINDSQAIVFQQDPDMPSDVISLAWLTKTCHANTQVSFSWTLDFNFVWGQNGQLKPGVDYGAGGSVPADLTTSNAVTLDYVDGGFEFSSPSTGPTKGSLFINETNNVPGAGSTEQGSVGIGMYGSGTFVVPTQPTGQGGGRQFAVHPQYWIAFGNHTAGEVVDESVLYFPTQVMFSGGSFKADAVFNGLGWQINYS
jgi:hypothetical protein